MFYNILLERDKLSVNRHIVPIQSISLSQETAYPQSIHHRLLHHSYKMPLSQPTLGWIWPKDPRPGNPSRWPRRWRFLDVLTNKGPDMYVGAIHNGRSTKKSNSNSNYSTSHWARWDKDLAEDDTLIPWARRNEAERYDFRRRKYVVPDQGTWSRVEYCSARGDSGGWRRGGQKESRHCVPRRYWDRNGDEYPSNHWHDIVYGAHGDAE